MHRLDLCKCIRNIIENHEYEDSKVSIVFIGDNKICVNLFETEIPIIIDNNKKDIYIESEMLVGNIIFTEILILKDVMSFLIKML